MYTTKSIEKIQNVCLMLNKDLMELDYIYSELEYKTEMEKNTGNIFYFNKKIHSLNKNIKFQKELNLKCLILKVFKKIV